MAYYIVWLDRSHAKILSIGSDHKSLKVTWEQPPTHTHANTSDHVSPAFYHEIAKNLADADEVLVVGPGTAKAQLKHHLEEHDRALAKKVVAYESADHPTDGQLLEHARRFFKNPLHAAH